MTLDSKQQQDVLLAAIDAAQWQGQVIEIVYAVKMALHNATISEPAAQEPEPQQ